jgi:transcriptional regulator of acetoin/glycerol metabolism
LLAWLDALLDNQSPHQPVLRLISAAKADLREQVDNNCFRADLFYRLAALCIELPGLSDRTDLAQIAARILRSIDADASLSASAAQVLQQHHWPGNIRELENVLISASLLAGPRSTVTVEHLPTRLTSMSRPPVAGGPSGTAHDLKSVTDTVIQQVLAEHDGNISRAARHLGVSRNTVYRFLRRQGGSSGPGPGA